MKRLRKKLKSQRGLTLVEMVAAAGVLALLSLMLHTGLLMAQNTYGQMTQSEEGQLLLSTISNLLSNELRYARDVEVDAAGNLVRYTSVNFGRNTNLTVNAEGQLEAYGKQMLSSGAYGNGTYRISTCSIVYQNGVFTVDLSVEGAYDITNQIEFSVRCLNGSDGGEGGST